jgi:hypothetical protein
MINKTFTFKLFLTSNKFGFASNIWSCLESYHDVQKQNILPFFFAKNKPVESTDCETCLPDATLTEVIISQNTDEDSGSKAEKRKFQDVSEVQKTGKSKSEFKLEKKYR